MFQICQLAYRLLRAIIRDNRENAIYASRYMHLFIYQLGYELRAEDTLTELMVDNIEMLEALDQDTVMVFIDLVRRRGRKPQFLAFLTACCSCNGDGVPSKPTNTPTDGW